MFNVVAFFNVSEMEWKRFNYSRISGVSRRKVDGRQLWLSLEGCVRKDGSGVKVRSELTPEVVVVNNPRRVV